MLRMIVLLTALLVGAVAILMWLVRRAEPGMAFFPLVGEDVTPQQFAVPYRPLTIETVDGERLRAWHLVREDASAQVLYLHGNGGNLSIWADILVGLWQHGLDVLAIDYRGYGLSSGRPSEQGLYRDVDATVAHLHQHLRRRDLPLLYWGRSLGSTMAAYAVRQQRPDGVVLEAGFPNAAAVLADNPLLSALSRLGTYRFDTSEWLATSDVPALIIHGDADSIIPYALGRRLYDGLPGPKQFFTVVGGDHNGAEPTDPDSYWRAIAGFIATLR